MLKQTALCIVKYTTLGFSKKQRHLLCSTLLLERGSQSKERSGKSSNDLFQTVDGAVKGK